VQASGGAVTRERPKKVVLPGLPWRQDIQALAVLSLVGIGVGAIFHQAALDDPYVTYRYASNLLRGDGFVYNPAEHILSTTAAGYALLLAVVGFPFPTLLPLISNVISILGIFSASVLLYAIAAWYGHRLAGLMAALLLELSPVLLASIGMETGVHASFIMAAFYLYFRGKLPWAAFFVVLAFLLRADAAIPAGLLKNQSIGGHHGEEFSGEIVVEDPDLVFFVGSNAMYRGSEVHIDDQMQSRFLVSAKSEHLFDEMFIRANDPALLLLG